MRLLDLFLQTIHDANPAPFLNMHHEIASTSARVWAGLGLTKARNVKVKQRMDMRDICGLYRKYEDESMTKETQIVYDGKQKKLWKS